MTDATLMELLLTGENRRWADRSAVWKQDWRNLHAAEPVEIEATFTLEGERQSLVASCTWPAGETELDAASTNVRGGRGGDGRAARGWDAALSTYRPFLPYNELGSIAGNDETSLVHTEHRPRVFDRHEPRHGPPRPRDDDVLSLSDPPQQPGKMSLRLVDADSHDNEQFRRRAD